MQAMQASISSGSSLHTAVDSLLANSTTPFNLVLNRNAFHDRVLRDAASLSSDHALMLDPHNPTLLKEETSFQKDQWSSLKFRYLELDAKRNFVTYLTGDNPTSVPPGTNEALEQSNAEKKKALKESKVQLETMRDETIRLAKANAEKHATVTKQLSEAQEVQKKIRDMELELARIKATYPAENRMTITQAEEILDQQTEEMQRLTEEQEEATQSAEEARTKVARTAKDIQRLERERDREEARAKEVQEGREAGDTKVDEMCRWLNSSISFYKNMMGIRSVTAVADNELHLEYDVADGDPIILKLAFDPATRALSNAEVEGTDLDIGEAVNIALANNDPPGLIADVLMLVRSRR
ncbi:hypothetical protein DB88DRAFT_487631 [Papiliotrema laurentii]|uniref:Kinetochore protein Sos7 coiled-coil domain-containing protein n=1 Tax=Papiliotrema laurentii TaxID=5418 RepID=A0AAD9FRS8_PAPLA|nr:hypothetical protein DB88DRAFT_487631 [Papiliotrema laurentii]